MLALVTLQYSYRSIYNSDLHHSIVAMRSSPTPPPPQMGPGRGRPAPAARPGNCKPAVAKPDELPTPVPTPVIAVYNYKGGVGKTSLTISLGAQLATSGHRVLMVDADSKCNLTAFFYPNTPAGHVPFVGREAAGDGAEPVISRHDLSATKACVQQAGVLRRQPREGDNLLNLPKQPREDDNLPKHWYAYCAGPPAGTEPPVPVDVGRYDKEDKLLDNMLLLLPGGHNTANVARKLSAFNQFADDEPLSPDASRCIGAFRTMLNEIVHKYQIHYVLIDCAPADDVINKIIAMTSDYLLPPVFPDLFSMSAMHGLLYQALPQWYGWRATLVARQTRDQPADAFRLSAICGGAPRILPFLVQNLAVYTQKNKKKGTKVTKVTMAKSSWIKGMQDMLMREDIPEIVSDRFRRNNGSMVIPFMKDLGTLYERSHECSTPIVNLTLDQLKKLRSQNADCEVAGIEYARALLGSLAAFLEYVRKKPS